MLVNHSSLHIMCFIGCGSSEFGIVSVTHVLGEIHSYIITIAFKNFYPKLLSHIATTISG